jgi:hypothetical protein
MGHPQSLSIPLVDPSLCGDFTANYGEFENLKNRHDFLPNRQTIGEHVTPQISMIYETRKLPRLLPVVGGTI